ncbi:MULTISPECIES: restriction endonuclease subunit S [unclassified Lentimonas]|uniref:restriction endonuclease subunit S n=1 Tax=unclassified Lentimonas TaxID=2630993 RepID=UPI001329DEA8|nr:MULTISPECIES: restriction endonuclease subunit S [unclassified Lentimonas]CAA6689989.1 Type I restriction-modification system, specificity subunit S (EC [Lentimonas sp. CC10]CAA6691064.1 Type I restriction-modification system, specificity subunit S (EC [Lentimonas sp. CC19]CAA7069322.1 Type I restriction-modification system, specificity subunit S (EC [Lentimonas sp. CC11]
MQLKPRSTSSVQAGYKQTEVGVIPEDWDAVSIRDIFNFKQGVQTPIDKQYESSRKGLVRFIRIIDLTNATEPPRYVEDPGKSHHVNHSDLFMVRYGTPGLIGTRCSGVIANNLFRLLPKQKVSKTFYYHYLGAKYDDLADLSGSSTMPAINFSALGNFWICVPTKAEQEAIAGALSDADAWIESLEQLIAKKRRIKEGASQALLTGKQRLPGFEVKSGYQQTEVGVIPNDWEATSLGSITTLMTNGFVGTATSQYRPDGVLYIQGYNVEENSFNMHGIKFVNEAFHKAHMKSCLREDDLLTVQTGDVGLTTIVPKRLAGSNCHALIISRFNKQDVYPQFISYYLNSKPGRARLRQIEVGTTMKHINVADMLQFLAPLPTKAEQTAIAAILSDMDAELDALAGKLSKARQIKQGMMQELLTGKTRLV